MVCVIENPGNASALSDMEKALFLVCLDEPSQPKRPDYNEHDEQMAQVNLIKLLCV